MSFFRVLDTLIRPSRRASALPEELRRLRVLAGITGLFFVETAGFLVVSPVAHTLSSVLSSLLVLAVFVVILVRLRAWGDARGSGYVLWLSVLLCIDYTALHRGGEGTLLSPVAGTAVLLAMYFNGGRGALIAAAASIVSIGAITVIHRLGYAQPPLVAGDPLMSNAAVSALGISGLTFLAWLNHGARERAYVQLADALQQLKKTETELRLAQKLEAVGRLAAGVAHEINTPVQFVSNSMSFIEEAIGSMSSVLREYETAVSSASTEARDRLAAAREAADLEFVVDEAPQAIARAKEGLSRVAAIVRSMRDFAHPDEGELRDVDLNRAIGSTLTIAAGEYKLVADVECDFASLPPVRCLKGEINQVVLNLLVNAAHTIADKYRGSSRRGHITVRTGVEQDSAVIAITDDGEGIAPEIRGRIFDPFFTTKALGRGTGQGLATAHAIVVKRHGGTLTFKTKPGVGTTFFIRLPLEGSRAKAA